MTQGENKNLINVHKQIKRELEQVDPQPSSNTNQNIQPLSMHGVLNQEND